MYVCTYKRRYNIIHTSFSSNRPLHMVLYMYTLVLNIEGMIFRFKKSHFPLQI